MTSYDVAISGIVNVIGDQFPDSKFLQLKSDCRDALDAALGELRKKYSTTETLAPDFKVGDLVQLKSGGENMTIRSIYTDADGKKNITVAYWSADEYSSETEKKLQQMGFSPECLVLA